jgi:Ca-activated chloride channel homolog
MKTQLPLVLMLSMACPASSPSDWDTGSFASTSATVTTSTTTTSPTTTEDCIPGEPQTLYLSPDDSNSMSSPVQAREAVLTRWMNLDAVPLRMWEFLNYYTFDYPPADPGELRLSLDLTDDGYGQYTLQIGVSSPPPTEEPVNLALVIDNSCSMTGAPLARVADVGEAIASQLRAGDRISVLTWSDDQDVLLDGEVVDGPDDPQLLAALAGLAPEGSTNLSAGLAAGYELLEQGFDAQRIQRLILISDGGANAGVTDEERIGSAAGNEDEAGIYLVGVGVGTVESYNDRLMDTVTDIGKGASVFVPDAAEAELMFADRFASTLGVAARDVHIQLDLPAGMEVVRTTAEEIATNPEDVRPQHIAPGDSMVLHNTLAAECGKVAPEASFGLTVTWLDPVTFAPREASATFTAADLLAQDHGLLAKGAALVAYVDALRAQRVGETQAPERVAAALSAVDEAELLLPGDPDLAEIRGVLLEL